MSESTSTSTNTNAPNISDSSQNEIYNSLHQNLDPRLNFGKFGPSTSAIMSILKNIKIGGDLTKTSVPAK